MQLPNIQVPIEALLLQIENHVRQEYAAAEVFRADGHAAINLGEVQVPGGGSSRLVNRQVSVERY